VEERGALAIAAGRIIYTRIIYTRP
jgi:hypothetical protein